jgi:trehalose 6-phosphate phosphatase
MKPLFTPTGLKLLESLSFTRTLFAFDFDGTLSRIVRDPAAAKLSSKTTSLLARLSELAPVALISGRSLQDLRGRVRVKPTYLVGNHGLEGLESREPALSEATLACVSWKGKLERTLLSQRAWPGLEIEDKRYSLALHYRRCRSKKGAKRAILESVSSLSPSPRIILGKCVVNILPPGAPHKGMAMLELMLASGIQSGFYVGDDDTDEDVFALPESRILTVRVGQKRSSQAQYFIRDQSEINRLLAQLIRFHQPRSALPPGPQETAHAARP